MLCRGIGNEEKPECQYEVKCQHLCTFYPVRDCIIGYHDYAGYSQRQCKDLYYSEIERHLMAKNFDTRARIGATKRASCMAEFEAMDKERFKLFFRAILAPTRMSGKVLASGRMIKPRNIGLKPISSPNGSMVSLRISLTNATPRVDAIIHPSIGESTMRI